MAEFVDWANLFVNANSNAQLNKLANAEALRANESRVLSYYIDIYTQGHLNRKDHPFVALMSFVDAKGFYHLLYPKIESGEVKLKLTEVLDKVEAELSEILQDDNLSQKAANEMMVQVQAMDSSLVQISGILEMPSADESDTLKRFKEVISAEDFSFLKDHHGRITKFFQLKAAMPFGDNQSRLDSLIDEAFGRAELSKSWPKDASARLEKIEKKLNQIEEREKKLKAELFRAKLAKQSAKELKKVVQIYSVIGVGILLVVLFLYVRNRQTKEQNINVDEQNIKKWEKIWKDEAKKRAGAADSGN